MGKVFQVLNRRDTVCQSTPAGTNPGATAAPLTPTEAVCEEIPFIEVGPRKSVEASPSVLAAPGGTLPRSTAVSPSRAAGPVPSAEAESFTPVWSVACRAPVRGGERQPDGAAEDSYRHLLSRLTLAATETPVRLLLFSASSAAADDATVTVVLNLARTAAHRHGRSVIVVDSDLRQPRVARELGLNEHPGLGEVLTGARTLTASLQPTAQENLSALTAGRSEAHPGVRFVAETVRSVLRQLRQRFDLVLVHGPRWDSSPEVHHLAESCDAVFLVLPATEAEPAHLDELLEAIPQRGAKLTGCILAS